MLVLVALSSITLDFTKDFAFQGRYEVTKDRYEKIKRAIIGRPDVLINGQPDISGFVADMGRLPRNIQELLVQNYCMPDYTISDNSPDADLGAYTSQQLRCEGEYPAALVKWVPQPDWINATSTTLGYGWRGPYLTTKNPDYEPNAFSDGWGNSSTDHNYGWSIVHVDNAGNDIATINTALADIANATDLKIQSRGKNGGALDNTDTGYDVDYPATQPLWDWELNIREGITTSFQKIMGSCEFTREPCLSTGGIWQESCTFENTDNDNLCGNGDVTNPDIVDTLWIESLDYCKFNQTSCESPNGHASESGAWKTCHFTESSCPGISGSWNELFTTSANCTAAGGTWNVGTSDCTMIQAVCEGNGGSWDSNTAYCNTCDTTTPTTQIDCEAANRTWDGSTSTCNKINPTQCKDIKGAWQPSCTFNKAHCIHVNIDGIWDVAKAQCSLDGYISKDKCIEQQGSWKQDAEYIFMKVNHRGNVGLLTEFSEPEKIFEDGNYQTITFIFDGDQADADIDDLFIPIGESKIGVYKSHLTGDNETDCNTNGYDWSVRLTKCFNQTDDFYPASCSGLTEGTDCIDADGGAAPTTAPDSKLLANGMCDNVTVTECTDAGGFVVRNVINTLIIPHKNIGTINW